MTMTRILKTIALGACAVVMMSAADAPSSFFRVGFVRDASAGLIVAPVRRTAVVTSVAVASTSANANAAASANANAAAQANAATAQANAATAQVNAAAAQAKVATPAVGSVVATLPPGCTDTKLNGVDYMRCGTAYYKPTMVGNNLVFVVAQP